MSGVPAGEAGHEAGRPAAGPGGDSAWGVGTLAVIALLGVLAGLSTMAAAVFLAYVVLPAG